MALPTYDEVIAKWDPVLGLEVHVELNTQSKMFCSCATEFGGAPNTQTCPVCLALPGALPVVNEKAIESTILIGLALNCKIAPYSRFARKNYFYPDMPKNFQISQYDEPICFDGYVDVEIETEEGPKQFRIEIERVHMEEDTGKSLHVGGATGRIHGADYSLLDYNRAGIPLVEIVTKIVPGTGKYAPEVAKAYVAELRDILRGLKVSDVKMEQGSLRCDANVSLKPIGSEVLGTRSETKNVNSLRSIERAIRGEMIRHAELLNDGKKVKQETRHFQEDTGLTRSGRSKEQAEDYRYFPDPDLVPVTPLASWIEELRATLPERPSLRRKRIKEEWNVPDKEMAAMINADVLDIVEATVLLGADPTKARTWWLGEISRIANEKELPIAELAITPAHVAELVELVAKGDLTDKLARQVVEGVVAGEGTPSEVVAKRGIKVVNDDGALMAAIEKVCAEQAETAEKVRGGHLPAGRVPGQRRRAGRRFAPRRVVLRGAPRELRARRCAAPARRPARWHGVRVRHAHRADVQFLDAFMDRSVTAASPVNAVAVLSRADEIGAGRLDAMESSARIAARYEQDPQLRGLCAAVVRLLLREDASGRLGFSPLQAPVAQAYLRARGLPTADFDSLVFVPDWERPESLPPLLRSEGALAAADEPGGICRVLSWLRILPRAWTDASYRGIARVRGVFGPPSSEPPADVPAWEKRFVR